jgi:chemotaxis protein methyltransferase CheR
MLCRNRRLLMQSTGTQSIYSEEKAFELLKRMIFDKIGLDCSAYRDSYLRGKVQHRMNEKHLATVWEYVRFIKSHPEEFDVLTTVLTVNYTCFFRDTDIYTAIKNSIYPQLIARGKVVRVLSAGCSYGQEPYTLGMLAHEVMGEKLQNYVFSIYAGDIDNACLLKARGGIYTPDEVKEISPHLLAKYFDKTGNNHQVKNDIKKLIRFKYLDLTKDLGFELLDMILCRNVFIYFSKEAQVDILNKFHAALKKDGYMILGKTETMPPDCKEKFSYSPLGRSIFQKNA